MWSERQRSRRLVSAGLLLTASVAVCQVPASNADEVAHLFKMDQDLATLRAMGMSRDTGPVTLAEVVLRQKVSEEFEAASLEVDAVISELSNEQSDLGAVRTELQTKRDKKVANLTTAALLTGSALGVAVNATQFTSLGNRTANVGDGIGIGSGAASTVLSLLAARAQNGPEGVVGETPNMLASLLGESTPVARAVFPPEVLAFLHEVAAGEDPGKGTRLEQLMASWGNAGRLQHRTALTTSGDTVKVTIDDLTNRIAMLGDVRGRISLIKRGLATLRRESLIEEMPANQ